MGKYIIFSFLIWRVGLFFIAWLGGRILPFSPSFPYSEIYFFSSGLPYWFWSFANFDGVHYLTITQKGYSAQFTQVFFPLYPLLIGIINRFLSFLNLIIIGIFLSNTLFLFSLIIFWKLLQFDYKEKEIEWIILFFLFFPTSFFFGSLYTESLFFFLMISSFYFARKKRWIFAGIFGAFASATKLVGIFLLPALFWEYYQEIKHKKMSHHYLKFFYFPPLYLIPLGLAVYMIYLQLTYGDALYFWHAQPVFGAQRSGERIVLLPQVLWRYGKILITTPFTQYNFWVAVWELGSMIISVGLLVVGLVKKIRTSYLIFGFLSIILPTLTGTFSSMPRYILLVFPMFIILGLIKSTLRKIFLLVICTFLLGIFVILFTRGHWVS